MNLMNLGKIGIEMTIAAGGLIAVATPAVPGTVHDGASGTKGAGGPMDGTAVEGSGKGGKPKAQGDNQFDVTAPNTNLPHNGRAISWHPHPGADFGPRPGGDTPTD